MYLKLALRTPSKKIVEYLQDIHGVHISESEVYCTLNQLAKLFGKHYKELEKLISISRVKNTDSTSWRINGKNYNAWVFITLGIVLYKITKHNNHKTPLKIFGKNQKQKILVVDRHSAFRTLAKKRGFILQLCWSHILVDSRDLAKSFGKEAKYVHAQLKKIYSEAKTFNHAGNEKDVEELKNKIFLLTQRHYKNHFVWRFTQNLYKRDTENLFLFVTNPDVEPTNNISERELRKIVIIRKISNGSRSKQGANNTATLLSILQTLKNNKQNLFQQLQQLANTSQN
jgi:transposase